MHLSSLDQLAEGIFLQIQILQGEHFEDRYTVVFEIFSYREMIKTLSGKLAWLAGWC